jgi:hypothetical protein
MNANADVKHPSPQQRRREAVVAVMARVAAIGSLVAYVGGVRLLLHRLALWLAIGEQIVRRASGFP